MLCESLGAATGCNAMAIPSFHVPLGVEMSSQVGKVLSRSMDLVLALMTRIAQPTSILCVYLYCIPQTPAASEKPYAKLLADWNTSHQQYKLEARRPCSSYRRLRLTTSTSARDDSTYHGVNSSPGATRRCEVFRLKHKTRRPSLACLVSI